MSNPYLRGLSVQGAPAPGAPGAFFGAASPAVYQPPSQGYFGALRVNPAAYDYNAGLQPCPPQSVRATELAQQLRHPLGQWPLMPPLSAQATQEAASCVVCNAQAAADSLQLVYGVNSGAAPLIVAGATATIIVTPQKRHIPEKLVMSEAMAAAFLITGIFAGVEPVLATTGPISSAIFVQDSTAAHFKSVIMDVGMDFSVGVTNISGADARFTTTVVGKPVPAGL